MAPIVSIEPRLDKGNVFPVCDLYSRGKYDFCSWLPFGYKCLNIQFKQKKAKHQIAD